LYPFVDQIRRYHDDGWTSLFKDSDTESDCERNERLSHANFIGQDYAWLALKTSQYFLYFSTLSDLVGRGHSLGYSVS
jgi:hypothetical protein